MKWSSKKGFNNQKVPQNKYVTGFYRFISDPASQATKIAFCFICTGMFLSGDGDRLKITEASVSPENVIAKVNHTAANISVRILDRDFLGSGFIMQKTAREYIVVTNQHVLRAGEPPYTVETVDGSTYSAEAVANQNDFNNRYDLAILKFQADATYQTATVGDSFSLEVGDRVFAAGFPYRESNSADNSPLDKESRVGNLRYLALQKGRVAIILNRALEEGYQIGYTNDVKKGMSGGPLLNEVGEVIGINGKHAYPLWESPEIYQDGTEPCPALQELITRSSLAIPIEKSIEINPRLKALAPPLDLDYSAKSPVHLRKTKVPAGRTHSRPGLALQDSEASASRWSNLPEKSSLVTKMQATAESTLTKCRESNIGR